MTKITTKVVPWSSVVGQSVAIHNESGRVIAQIMICGATRYPKRETAEAMARMIQAALDEFEGDFGDADESEAG